jgi:hypothetical protein
VIVLKSIFTTVRKLEDYKNCMSILDNKEKQIVKNEYNKLLKQKAKYGSIPIFHLIVMGLGLSQLKKDKEQRKENLDD